MTRPDDYERYVHARLDALGVPHHPPAPRQPGDCRVGARLDWVEDQLAAYAALLDSLPEDADMIEHNSDEGASYHCCGSTRVYYYPDRRPNAHAADCWYAAAIARRAELRSPTSGSPGPTNGAPPGA